VVADAAGADAAGAAVAVAVVVAGFEAGLAAVPVADLAGAGFSVDFDADFAGVAVAVLFAGAVAALTAGAAGAGAAAATATPGFLSLFMSAPNVGPPGTALTVSAALRVSALTSSSPDLASSASSSFP
jgi:hypothetical protein